MDFKEKNKRIFFDFNHPVDYHLFKYTIGHLQKNGFSCKIVARDKDCLQSLLKLNDIKFIGRGKGSRHKTGKYIYALVNLVIITFQLIKFRPSLTISLSSPYLILSSNFLRIPCLTFDDTDYNPRLLPLIKKSDYIFSPLTYPFKFHNYHFHLNGFKELAYLHPNYFEHSKIFERNGIFIRYAEMNTIHHQKKSRINYSVIVNELNRLIKEWPVFFSCESECNANLSQKITIPDVNHVHEALNKCQVFWGNSSTMAAEAAILGIPAIYVGPNKLAYIKELEDFGLLFYFPTTHIEESFNKLIELVRSNSLYYYMECKEKLLKKKMDMTAFLVWFIEKYPKSIEILNGNPDFQGNFIGTTEQY